MRRHAFLLLGLLLLSLPAFVAPRATQAQQVPNPMSKDAANAQLPQARQNLDIDTVKSEGGTPPNANSVTRFYNHDNYKQHEIASHTYANEYALEQAGLGAPGGVGVGQGATRVCTAPYSNNQVNCNYVAYGRLGQHRFGNGAGFTTEIINQSTGMTTAWPQLISSDDEIARLWAAGATDVRLELKAKGSGTVDVLNGTGSIARFFGAAGVSPIFLIGQTASSPARLGSSGGATEIGSHRPIMSTQTGAVYSVLVPDSGMSYDNIGATAQVQFWLPTAARGLQYCFTVDAAFQVFVKAGAADRIAMAATNGALGGSISSSAPHASICIESHKAGQWIVRSTPDKAQWNVL